MKASAHVHREATLYGREVSEGWVLVRSAGGLKVEVTVRQRQGSKVIFKETGAALEDVPEEVLREAADALSALYSDMNGVLAE
jgi:hypothetical protein